MSETKLAIISNASAGLSLAQINDVLHGLTLCVALVSGILAIIKHFKKK